MADLRPQIRPGSTSAAVQWAKQLDQADLPPDELGRLYQTASNEIAAAVGSGSAVQKLGAFEAGQLKGKLANAPPINVGQVKLHNKTHDVIAYTLRENQPNGGHVTSTYAAVGHFKDGSVAPGTLPKNATWMKVATPALHLAQTTFHDIAVTGKKLAAPPQAIADRLRQLARDGQKPAAYELNNYTVNGSPTYAVLYEVPDQRATVELYQQTGQSLAVGNAVGGDYIHKGLLPASPDGLRQARG